MPLRRLDWGVWVYGLLGGFIGGGAGAVGAAFGVVNVDQNALSHPTNLLVIACWSFVFSGLASAFAYLKQSPLPPEIKTTVETTELHSNPPAIVKTTVETTEAQK